MSGISKPYNNSTIQKSYDFREFANITRSNATYFQKQCSPAMLRLTEKLMKMSDVKPFWVQNN